MLIVTPNLFICGREVYAFWVNQDVVVPPAAFLGAVRGAAASPLNRRLLAG